MSHLACHIETVSYMYMLQLYNVTYIMELKRKHMQLEIQITFYITLCHINKGLDLGLPPLMTSVTC